jgi:MOSC domain-containing protein YiiM
MQLAWGVFGENLTISGIREDTTFIGDTFRIGSAEFTVTQPRLPCFKLGMRFDRPDVLKRMMQSGHTGFYVKVTREGEIEPGDSFEWLARDEHQVSVFDLVGMLAGGGRDVVTMKRALQVKALAEAWRDDFRSKIAG